MAVWSRAGRTTCGAAWHVHARGRARAQCTGRGEAPHVPAPAQVGGRWGAAGAAAGRRSAPCAAALHVNVSAGSHSPHFGAPTKSKAILHLAPAAKPRCPQLRRRAQTHAHAVACAPARASATARACRCQGPATHLPGAPAGRARPEGPRLGPAGPTGSDHKARISEQAAPFPVAGAARAGRQAGHTRRAPAPAPARRLPRRSPKNMAGWRATYCRAQPS